MEDACAYLCQRRLLQCFGNRRTFPNAVTNVTNGVSVHLEPFLAHLRIKETNPERPADLSLIHFLKIMFAFKLKYPGGIWTLDCDPLKLY